MAYAAVPFADITEAAYRLLLAQPQGTLPIHPLKLRVPGVLILSFREWGLRAGLTPGELAVGQDGYLCLGVLRGASVILYNDEQPYARARFTLFHELGHHLLCHRQHGPLQEIEANFFASQCIAPTALLVELRRRGFPLDIAWLRNTFDMSVAAAQHKLSYLARHPDGHPGPLDARVVAHFSAYLTEYFPDILALQDARALASYAD